MIDLLQPTAACYFIAWIVTATVGRSGFMPVAARIARWMWFPTAPAILLADLPTIATVSSGPWNTVGAIAAGTFFWLLVIGKLTVWWWLRPRDDIDRWKRRTKRAVLRVVGGRIVAVPAGGR